MGRFRLRRNDVVAAAGLLAVSLILATLLQGLVDDFSWLVLTFLFLLAASGLFLSFRHLRASVAAARRLVQALAAHGVPVAWDDDPVAAANAAGDLLDRYEAKTAAALRELREAKERQVEEVTRAHRELLTHHQITKRMLKSQNAEEVFRNLLEGVRDGLGFDKTLLGVRTPDGDIVFEGSGGAPAIRIGVWRSDSVAARALWSGQPQFLGAAHPAALCREDRLLAEEGPALFVPVVQKPSRRCAQMRHCANTACPAYAAETLRCWLVPAACSTGRSWEAEEEKRRRCAQCEVFSAKALLVVKSSPAGRSVDTHNTGGVTTIVNEAALALEVAELYEHMKRLSVTDGLTGLVNHREFYNLLRRELERARRYGNTVSVLIIDVDDFKRYNDTYGHLEGDIALKAIAQMLLRCARATDIVARYGGEEFAIVLPESSPGGALMLAERIKNEIFRHDFMPQGRRGVHLSVSIGIYSSEAGGETEDQVVSYADEAAYNAKFSGKNRVVVKAHA